MADHRVYVGVLPPRTVSDQLEAQLVGPREALAQQGVRMRWLPPSMWHVTLLFCPHAADDRLAALDGAVARLAVASEAFRLRVRGGDAFPELARARHLVADLDDPSGGLGLLASALRTIAAGLDLEHSTEPFRPHLTLGRVNRPCDRSLDAVWLRALETSSWQVAELALVESLLQRQHPAVHRVLRRHALA